MMRSLNSNLSGGGLLLAYAASLGLALFQAEIGRADPPQLAKVTATDVAGQVHAGSLQEIAAGKLVLDGTPPRALALAKLIRVDWDARRAVPAGAEPVVLLANGDRLVVRPERIDDEFLTGQWVRFPAWPAVRIPLETLRGVLLNPPRNRPDRVRLANQIIDQTELHDLLFLSNGDRTTGELTGLDPTTLKFEAAVGQIELDRKAVRGFGFNPELTSFPETPSESVLVLLEDGSRLTVTGISLTKDGALHCHAAFGGELTIPSEQIVSLRFLGGAVTYLSDLEPTSYRFTPYLSVRWPLRRDRSTLGGPLSLRGTEYPKGLGTHSQSDVSYALDGKYRSFQAVIGIDDETAGAGSVIFRVLADGQQVYRSDTVRGDSPPIAVGPLDVTGVKVLTLAVDFADLGDIQDHADWCDALLVK